MAQQLLVLDEVLVMMRVVGIGDADVARFQQQAELVIGKKPRKALDEIAVASVFGRESQRGGVELTVNKTLTQMEPAKAREVGLMLLEAAEAAIGDEVFLTLLRDRVGITDSERLSRILLDLRELRQGTRGTSHPS